MYPPIKIDGEYEPKLGQTGLYYCGRKVMHGHNFPDYDICDGVWGPDSGPNWPACRTQKTDKMDELNAEGKMQGYSGMIYCGKAMKIKEEGHDGTWGPDNGPPWDEWIKYLYEDDDVKSMHYLNNQNNKSSWLIF